MKNKQKYLLAVSGGPDSMNLLWKYRHKNIVVAHINYNYRGGDSLKDLELIKNFCKKFSIPFYFLNLDQKYEEKYKYIKNKQSKWRKIRYDYLLEIAKLNDIKTILLGHNKDDFLETAIMQYRKNSKDKLFFGIKKKNKIFGFVFKRPLIKLWKSEILDFNKENQIPFREDQTNLLAIYERNKIRLLLQTYSFEDKKRLLKEYLTLNKANKIFLKTTNQNFKKWKESQFSIKQFKNLNEDIKKSLVFYFINESNEYISLTSGKITSIIAFIESKKNINKTYKLNERFFLKKEHDNLILEIK